MNSYHKLFKFGIVGVFATLIHVIVASWLIEGKFQTPVPVANIFAFLVATTFSYIGNTKWSFSENFSRSNGMRFSVTAVIGCFLAYIISVVADNMGLHYLIGIALIVLCIPAMTFLSHFFWTYRPRDH